MKIAATTVGMDAARTYREVEQRISRLNRTSIRETAVSEDGFSIRLSRSLDGGSQKKPTGQTTVSRARQGFLQPMLVSSMTGTGKAKVLSQLTQRVLGQPVTINSVFEHFNSLLSPADAAFKSVVVPTHYLELSRGMVYQEETFMFSAQGFVVTSDGKEISLDFGLSLERRKATMVSNSIDLTTLIDPIILQFAADAPFLCDSSFSFDMDNDGIMEEMARPGKGCGFLALDRNGDGCINNGFELFGPATGSGFAELAELDSDANRWIDENDPVFDLLSIWDGEEQGNGSLRSLRTMGVGAISIDHAGTSFQLENREGSILGNITASGIYLSENGEVRTLQEVDLARREAVAQTSDQQRSLDDAGLEAALQRLRDIMQMQQFRLKMLLARQHLQGLQNEEGHRRWLLAWLQEHKQQMS